MGKRKKETPEHLDYLFEREILQEEDYPDFWQEYWKLDRQGDKQGQKDLENQYLQLALEFGDTDTKLAGVVTKFKSDAVAQATAIKGRVVRRNAKGQFSKRGHYYQAIRKGKRE